MLNPRSTLSPIHKTIFMYFGHEKSKEFFVLLILNFFIYNFNVKL